MDVVYVVRPGDDNEELRYSLRSIVHVPHDRVFIAGYCPSWLRNVTHISVPVTSTKWETSTKNLLAACETSCISDQFVYMNDDMFVMHAIDAVPTYHRGQIDVVIAEHHDMIRRRMPGNLRYLNGMERTAKLLERVGIDRATMLSYELHVPMVVDKTGMVDAIRLGSTLHVAHKRTIYGNLSRVGGTQIGDVKVSRTHPTWSSDWTFVSTDDESFATMDVGTFVRDTLVVPGPYERTS